MTKDKKPTDKTGEIAGFFDGIEKIIKNEETNNEGKEKELRGFIEGNKEKTSDHLFKEFQDLLSKSLSAGGIDDKVKFTKIAMQHFEFLKKGGGTADMFNQALTNITQEYLGSDLSGERKELHGEKSKEDKTARNLTSAALILFAVLLTAAICAPIIMFVITPDMIGFFGVPLSLMTTFAVGLVSAGVAGSIREKIDKKNAERKGDDKEKDPSNSKKVEVSAETNQTKAKEGEAEKGVKEPTMDKAGALEEIHQLFHGKGNKNPYETQENGNASSKAKVRRGGVKEGSSRC